MTVFKIFQNLVIIYIKQIGHVNHLFVHLFNTLKSTVHQAL